MENSVAAKAVNKFNKDNNPEYQASQSSENEDTCHFQNFNQLLKLFPLVVWDHICSFLDSKDFLNLQNSSLLFRQLFYEKRVLFLYKPVYEILLENLSDSNGKSSLLTAFLCRQNNIVLPFILKSRLICQTWKRTVDKLASVWNEYCLEYKSLTHQLLSVSYYHLKVKEVQKFIKHFNTSHLSHANPFIGKCISLNLQIIHDPHWLELSTEISNLLEKYGTHLQTCELVIMLASMDDPEPHQKINKWLNWMPNLETLKIENHFQVWIGNPPENPIAPVPLKLQGLKKLLMKNVYSAVSPNYDFNWSWIEHYNLAQIIRNQKKLECVNITMYTKSEAQILKDMESPLKELQATYFCRQNDINLLELCADYSEKYSESLESLKVELSRRMDLSGHTKIMQDSFYGRLNLSKVKIFGIWIRNSMFSLDFLLGMQDSLEELYVGCVGKLPGNYEYSNFCVVENGKLGLMEDKQIIKFLGYQDKMLESNIWNIFPKLGLINLNFSGKRIEYKREDWIKNSVVCLSENGNYK